MVTLRSIVGHCILPIVRRTKDNPARDARLRRHQPNAGAGEDVAPGDAEEPPGNTAETREIGGPKGPEPTRYGDWERNGRCIDF